MVILENPRLVEMADDGGFDLLYNGWEHFRTLYYRGIFTFLVLVEYVKTNRYFRAAAACVIAGIFIYGVFRDPIVMFMGMVVAFLLFVLLFRPR